MILCVCMCLCDDVSVQHEFGILWKWKRGAVSTALKDIQDTLVGEDRLLQLEDWVATDRGPQNKATN